MIEKNKIKICAVIVTYNRKKELSLNLKQLKLQTYPFDKIIIIDNHGNDDTLEYLKKIDLYDDSIEYIYLDENIGGAGGFSYGLKVAYEKGYGWIYLMDDDGRPYNENTLANITEYINKNEFDFNDKYFLNSLVTCDGERLSFTICGKDYINELSPKNGVIAGDANPFNGTMLSKGLVKNIGLPNSDFFIKGDEVDYLLRAQKNGAKILTICDSLYYHPTPFKEKRKRFVFWRMYFFVESPWKEYYSMRNRTYSLIQNGEKKKIFMNYIKRRIVAFKCHSSKDVIKMIKKGYKDGKNGKLGATIKP